jgi:hypothetical protein
MATVTGRVCEKIAQKVAQPIFLYKIIETYLLACTKIWSSLVISKNAKSKPSANLVTLKMAFLKVHFLPMSSF